MTTRIGTDGPGTGVSASASAARVTAAPARPFSAALSAGASAILNGAEQAVTRLPGGPILAAALRPAAAGVSIAQAGAGGSAGASLAPEGTAGTAGSAASATAGAASSGVAAGSGDSGGIEAALNQSANQNLYFMEIQERISAESRSYSTISNVLKARHDTVKNAIGNIR